MRADQLRERDDELAGLQAALEALDDDRGALVVVEGPAGIGKTALLAAARDRARAAGRRLLSARGSELEAGFPFGLVHQLLDGIVFGADAERRERLFAGAAGLAAPLFEAEHALAAGAGDDLYPRLHGLHWLCANLAAEEPLVIVVDDAQWGDEPSLRFLSFVARRLEDLPLVLLVGTRPPADAADHLVAGLITDPAARVLRPGALSDAAVGDWVRAAFGAGADPSFVAACHAVTSGNPFLTAELLRAIAEQDIPPTAAGARRVRELVPGGVASVVLQRVAALPPGAVELGRAVAVLGDGTPLALAAELAGLDAATAQAAVAALVRAELFEDRADLAFAHPVVRTAVLQGITPTARAVAHARAAELLAARGAPVEERAAQLRFSTPAGDAGVVETLRSAAARAASLGSPGSAVALLERALAEPPSSEVRTAVLLELGRAAGRGGLPGAERHLRAAIDGADDEPGRAQAALELARALKFRGAAAEAVAVLEPRARHADGLDPALAEAVRVELLSLGYIGMEARALLAERRHGLVDPGTPATTLQACELAGLAFDAACGGQPAEVVADRAARALRGDHLGRDPFGDGYARVLLGVALLWVERYDEADAVFADLIAGARHAGSVIGLLGVLGQAAYLQARRGDLARAEADAAEALTLAAEAPGGEALLNVAQAMAVLVALERGIPREQLDALAAGVAAGAQDDDALAHDVVLEARAAVLAHQGDVAGAVEGLLACGRREAAWEARSPSIVAWRSQAALPLTRLDRADEARALAAEELALAEAIGAPRAIGVARRAVALVAPGGPDADGLRAAVEVLAGSDARLEHARALVDLGAALRRAGDRTTAREPLRRGRELAIACGARPLAARARDEMLASGLRTRDVPAGGLDELTPSERRVADLAADGLTNRAIAQELFVTEKTVETHLRGVFQKLGLRSRTELPEALAVGLAA